jgi:hypothetical protein
MADPYSLDGDTLVLRRELTELDEFVRDFLAVLTHHSNYLIVSGYVSISTGRTRATEDVDLLVPVMSEALFVAFFEDLARNGFWCYQADMPGVAYPYMKDKLHLRFARTGEMFPNIELIPVDSTKKLQYYELHHPQPIRIHDFSFKIPPLEFEILYKEKVLAGPKDLADARHLRTVFSRILSEEKFKKFEGIMREP